MARVWDFGAADEWQFCRQRAQFSHLLVGGVTPPGADQQCVRIGHRRTERATGNPLENLARTDQPVRGRCRRAWKMRYQVKMVQRAFQDACERPRRTVHASAK